MSRSVPEWEGKTDDTPIPPRVRLRIFDKYKGRCANPLCGTTVITPAYDHIVALINGGRNIESNIQLLCSACHNSKTAADVAEKSVIYNKRAKRLKLKKRRLIPGSKGSGFRKKMDGTVIKE